MSGGTEVSDEIRATIFRLKAVGMKDSKIVESVHRSHTTVISILQSGNLTKTPTKRGCKSSLSLSQMRGLRWSGIRDRFATADGVLRDLGISSIKPPAANRLFWKAGLNGASREESYFSVYDIAKCVTHGH